LDQISLDFKDDNARRAVTLFLNFSKGGSKYFTVAISFERLIVIGKPEWITGGNWLCFAILTFNIILGTVVEFVEGEANLVLIDIFYYFIPFVLIVIINLWIHFLVRTLLFCYM
jgi:hypothetical protein